MMMRLNYFFTGLLIFCTLLLGACQDDKTLATPQAEQTQKIYTVRAESNEQHLFFNGIVAPLDTFDVVSPVEGVITQKKFHYGQHITKGLFLLEIDSKKLETDFKNALKDYLKSKNTLEESKNKYESNRLLRDAAGLIPENELRSSKNSKETQEMNYNQARNTLNDELKQIRSFHPDNPLLKDITQLSIGNKEVDEVLLLDFSEIKLYAPDDGVALFATEQRGESSSSKTIDVGSEVKKGQVLVTLGDLKGLSMHIKINEVNINKIKPGLPVTITGVAFPNIVLHGTVDEVDSQAKADQGGGLPVFNVSITVPELTQEQQDIIHVGMSAKITLMLKSPEQLTIPIRAVHNKEGQAFVKLLDADGKTRDVTIETGQTTATSVTVLKGLKAGDNIVLGD